MEKERAQWGSKLGFILAAAGSAVGLGNIWKLEVPKDRLVSLIDAMDADEDGFVSFGEVRDLLEEYGVKLKRSMRFVRKH